MAMRILVMIPAYNKEACIGDVVGQVREQVPDADILVVDGCSTDRTFERALGTGARAIRVSSAYGIGGAVEGIDRVFRPAVTCIR